MRTQYTKVEGVYLDNLPLPTDILISLKEHKGYTTEEYFRIIKSDVIEIPEIVFEKITGSKNITYENTYKLINCITNSVDINYLIFNEEFPLCLKYWSASYVNEHYWYHIYFRNKDNTNLLSELLFSLQIRLISSKLPWRRYGIPFTGYLYNNQILVPKSPKEVSDTDWGLIHRFNVFLREIELPYELIVISERIFNEQYKHLLTKQHNPIQSYYYSMTYRDNPNDINLQEEWPLSVEPSLVYNNESALARIVEQALDEYLANHNIYNMQQEATFNIPENMNWEINPNEFFNGD